MEEKKTICVLCGWEWGKNFKYTNRCENPDCDGFCTWGYELNKPSSFTIDENNKWYLNPTPKENKLCEKSNCGSYATCDKRPDSLLHASKKNCFWTIE